MPVIPDPVEPWLKPENASVFDSYWTQLTRMLARAAGADDPVGSVMSPAAALEVPGAASGLQSLVKLGRGALEDIRPAALKLLGPAKWKRGLEGRYANTVLTGKDAEHVMAAIENVAKRFPSLRKALPEMAKALQAQPPSTGTIAKGLIREPESGIILPSPQIIARWARYGLYGQDIPANWGPLTQHGIVEAFGDDAPREIKLYSDLWGAISPRNDPLTNTKQANRMLARTLGREGFSPLSEVEHARLGMGLQSRRDNINRAMAGEPLSGPKVPKMSGMLEGTSTRPPIDEHVTTASGGASSSWNEEIPALRARIKELTGEEFKGPAGEERLNEIVGDALMSMWEAMYPDRPPLVSMGSGWEGIRSDKGIKSVGGPYDVLRRLGLHTPGAMLDPKKLLGAKWPGGYISTGTLLPLLLERWNAVTDAQPENAPTSDAPPR